MKKLIIFIGILNFCFQSLAMHQDVVRKYKGEPITPENIKSLIGKQPTSMLKAIDEFLNKIAFNSPYKKYDLIKQLIAPANLKFSDGNNNINDLDKLLKVFGETLKDKGQENSMLFPLLNVKNMTTSNYVFHCPNDPNWIIKTASAANRLVNLLTSTGINAYTGKPMGDRKINFEAIRNKDTYQTISVAETSLMLQDLAKSKDLKGIGIPKTYLYRLTNMNHPSTNDSNNLVIQEFVPGLVHFYDYPNLLNDPKLVTKEMTRELKLAIAHAALWNLSQNLAICLDENSPYYKKLVLFDTEQRNLTSPEEFTKVEADLYSRIGDTGLSEVKKLFASRPDLVDILNQ